jgi:hypothetical protein
MPSINPESGKKLRSIAFYAFLGAAEWAFFDEGIGRKSVDI